MRLGKYGERLDLRMQPQLLRSFFEQYARRLDRQRRHRERPGARRVERPGGAGYADFPVYCRVLGFEFLVGNRSVGELGAGYCA